jgi:hypothetical protein
MNTLLKFGHVFTNIGTSNAGVALDVHVIAQGDHDLLNLLSQLTSGARIKAWVPLIDISS